MKIDSLKGTFRVTVNQSFKVVYNTLYNCYFYRSGLQLVQLTNPLIYLQGILLYIPLKLLYIH